MRITDSNANTSLNSQELAPVKSTANTGVDALGGANIEVGASSGQDHIALSGVSRIVNAGVNGQSAKLASLAAAVRSGQYNVSSSALSHSLVSETLARSASV